MKVAIVFEVNDGVKDKLDKFIELSIKELKAQFGDKKIIPKENQKIEVDLAFFIE